MPMETANVERTPKNELRPSKTVQSDGGAKRTAANPEMLRGS
jgi:hypothetical protein